MKLIITGATGYIGGEALRQAIARPDISSVVVLTRRPLPGPEAKDPKVQTVILKDFNTYPDSVVSQLAGADACIWSLGLALPDNLDMYREINVDYPTAGVAAFAKALAPRVDGSKFRFTFVSGAGAVRDQDTSLWFLRDARRVRGVSELNMIQASKDHADKLEVFVARPAAVMSTWTAPFHPVVGRTYSVKVGHLAAALLDVSLNGGKNQLVENSELVERGKKFIQT